ncbi:MAG: 2'-5' RNA ligase [Ignavibacteria bacterium RBG_13_36_8]|nr:MAG: 2'-5' RNA ligase [Ignavibacteria bacterium RBG_13_36_8]
MTNRLFVSLDLPECIQEEVIKNRDKIYGDDSKIRWETKEKLHLTLKFLEDVEESRTKEIEDELKSISIKHSIIELSFSRFGIFYKERKPRILWIGLNDSLKLNQLQDEVERSMENLGFEREKRKFKSHITLLRIKGYEDLDRINKFGEYKLPEINFAATDISLMKSTLTHSGSIYTRLKSFKLI